MEPTPGEGGRSSAASTNGIPGREASIAYAAVHNAAYVDTYCEQLAALNFSDNVVRTCISGALTHADPDTLPMNMVLNAIPRPLPAYLDGRDLKAFGQALDIQAEREKAARLRRMG